jgi:hypothetical protein
MCIFVLKVNYAKNSLDRLRTKRTGIAVTDEMQIIVLINNYSKSTAIAFLKEYFAKEKVKQYL